MAALDDLSPDRRAVLQLLVARGRGYDEIADLLHLPEIVVRRRSHDALTELAGGAGALEDASRALLCDYLVGELPASRRAEARSLLAEDPAARRFARAAAARLSSMPGAQLPELPPEDEEVADALDALDARRDREEELATSSKKGAWLLVGAVAAVVIAAVIGLSFIAGGGDDESPAQNTPSNAANAPKGTRDGTDGTSARTLVLAKLAAAPGGSGSGTTAFRGNAGGSIDFAAQITGLPKRQVFPDGRYTAYGFWLQGPGVKPLSLGYYNSDTGNVKEGDASLVLTLDGNGVPGLTPKDLDAYEELVVSLETFTKTGGTRSTPTRVLVSGKLGSSNS